MAAVRIIRRNRRRRGFLPRPRVFRDRGNPLEDLEEEEVYNRYRFRPHTILFITAALYNTLESDTNRNQSLPPLLQVLIFLRFAATGAHLRLVGDSLGVSESSVGRTVKGVASAIVNILCGRFITFPAEEMALKVKEGFRRVAGFPTVLGCIDCTHVRISTPNDNEVDYVNRKGYHSLNIQMVCDPNFRITSLCARWPGSTHDSRIWKNSSLFQMFENGTLNGLLLGDSGYPLSKHLMTPFLTTQTPAEERFNASLCRTRVLIEQTFGILKRKFQLLHFGIRSSPDQAIVYITACSVLHNIGIERGDTTVSSDCRDINIQNCLQQIVNANGPVPPARTEGIAKRIAITNGFF